MPWQEMSIMSSRAALVSVVSLGGVSVAEVCRRMGISRKTGCKWLARARAGEGLEDRSRRPLCSPARTPEAIEALVLAARAGHPAWGGRKLAAWLRRRGVAAVPSASTITSILRRHGQITPAASEAATPWTRFERSRPNELWQMDFKGHVGMTRGGRCHPLTVLDDHSRYCVGLEACVDEREETVRTRLTRLFRLYGLPERMLCDHGSPWGAAGEAWAWTGLAVWLLKLGVVVMHGRPRHPQTQGKEERFHRTLKAEVLSRVDVLDVADAQARFDPWRVMYNEERPHEALGNQPPASRYRPSVRAYPEGAVRMEYDEREAVRRVSDGGVVRYQGVQVRVGKALEGERVALRATGEAGVVRVCLGPHELGTADLRGTQSGQRGRVVMARLERWTEVDGWSATHVSEQV